METFAFMSYLILFLFVKITSGLLQVQPFVFPKSAIVGQKITALCSITSSDNEKITFSWMKDGRTLDSKMNIFTRDGVSTLTLNNLSEEDEGNYTCKVTSPRSGSDSFTASLHVLVPARWDQRPPAQLQAMEGSSVSLQCRGSGKPPPNTAWTGPRVHNGSSLVFPRVSRGDQGIYRCQVSNNVGPELEAATFLAVHGMLQVQPFSFPKSAIVGQKMSVLCTTTSTSNERVSFAWLKDGRDLSSHIKINTIEGISTITFSPLSEEDEGNYTCKATSPASGSDSFTAPLHVLVPARWDQRPPPQVQAIEGSSVALQCSGLGRPIPSSTWTGPRVVNSSSLVFPRVSRGDQGIYRCQVTNNVGPDLEAATFLAVHGNLKIQPFYFPTSAMVGLKVTATCSPYTASGKINFYWQKDGRDLHERIKVNTIEGVSMIVFDPLTEEDEGNYTCRGSSPSAGSDSFTAPLHVLVPARWEYRPPAQHQAMEGASVSLQCKGTGRPPPISLWTGPRVTNGSSLVFPRVSRGDQGIYRCKVTNNVGPELEASTFLAVNEAVKIQPFSFPKSAIVGVKVTGLCSPYSANEKVTFTWLKDGRELDGRVKVSSMDGYSTILFNPLSEEDEGNYTCRVTSPSSGSDSFTAPLHVLGWFYISKSMESSNQDCVSLVPARWDQRPPPQVQATEGSSVSFQCSGSGRPPPTSHWTGPRVTNGSSLVLARVSRGDQGIYRCLVTNNVGPELESSTFLAVHGQILRNPITRSNIKKRPDQQPYAIYSIGCQDCNAKYVVERGSQRYESGTTAKCKQCVAAIIVWQTMSILVVGGLLLISSAAVGGSLRIEPFHFSKTAIVGQKTSALCSTTSTRSDRLSFTWVKDGRDLDQRIKVTTYDGVSTIIFNPLTEEDEGNYTCRVTSPGQGSDSYTAPLNVLVPARWEQRPPAQLKAQEGTTLSIPCIGAGKPLPTTLWTGPRVTNGSSLVFAKVTRADQGIYRCLVTNNVGPELEASTFLAVLVPAKFEDKFSVLTVRRGESVTMKCQARGDKPLAIAWSKDKKLLDLDKTPGSVLSISHLREPGSQTRRANIDRLTQGRLICLGQCRRLCGS
ncbi:TTN [Cordylochernes scorpioides]|uniref:TTN n=1 Tax=Cordylochernes scorpioides TaxID=51811 RepID=A0ABY6L6L5_9ARAC|nr:TTN [Cordylochernes scorpioides]